MQRNNTRFGSAIRTKRKSTLVASAVSPLLEAMEPRQMMSAVPITTSSLLYSQNFTGDTVPTGWILKEVGSSGTVNQQAAVGNGSASAGDVYLFGASSSDRSFGTLLSGSNTPTIGAVFRNDTGQLITDASIQYNGEMWRLGQANRGADALNFGYRVVSGAEPTDPTAGPFTAVPALNFNSPVTTGTAGPLNGNAAPNRTDNINSALPGLSWAPGAYLMVQWTDFNVTGSDDGLAVDDFSLTVSGVTADGPGAIVIDPASKIVNEQAGTVSFNVGRVGGTQGSISADILMNDGTAVAGDDFGAPSLNTVSFADGSSTAQTITIPIVDDTKYELAEQFAVSLSNPQGSNGAPALGSAATVTITDNDTAYFKESFESAPGTGYTLDGATGDYQTPSGTSTIYSYFGRFASPDTTAVGRKDFTSGFDGGFAIHGQFHSADAFGEAANPLRTVRITPIDVIGRSDLSAYFSLGADAAEPAFLDWNNTDGISIYATVDGGSRTLIGQFKPSNVKGDLKLDTNFDGVGDGVTLRQGALQDFAFDVPGTGSSLALDVEVTSTAGFQAWTVDNVRVDGTLATTTMPAWVGPGAAATWNAVSHTLTVTGPTTIIADPIADAANIVASGAGAVVAVAPTNDKRIHLAGLSLTNGARLSVDSVGAGRTTTNHRLLIVPAATLTIDATSTLDLNDNDMIYDYSGATPQAGAVKSLIASACNGGAWTGFGITSSSAKTDAAARTTLGYMEASEYKMLYGEATLFDGESFDGTSVVVSYTLYGDADLDGGVSINDFNRVSTAFGTATGNLWSSGDFDNDNGVSINDFNLLSSNFGRTMPATPAVLETAVARKGVAPTKGTTRVG